MMNKINRVLIIAKTQYTNYLRYPENSLGYVIYIGAILFMGLSLQLVGGSNAEIIFGAKPLVYYTISLFLFTLIGNQNSSALAFSIWRLDILSKPLDPELFLLGNYLGSLLSNIPPSIFLLILSLIIAFPSLTTSEIAFLVILFLLSILASIAVSYFFAGIGLTTTPQGYLYTSITLLLTIFVGIIIPVSMIPFPLKLISYFIPYTWAIDCFRGLFLKTQTILPIESEILILLISTPIMLLIGRFYLFYKLNVIRSKKVVIR